MRRQNQIRKISILIITFSLFVLVVGMGGHLVEFYVEAHAPASAVTLIGGALGATVLVMVFGFLCANALIQFLRLFFHRSLF